MPSSGLNPAFIFRGQNSFLCVLCALCGYFKFLSVSIRIHLWLKLSPLRSPRKTKSNINHAKHHRSTRHRNPNHPHRYSRRMGRSQIPARLREVPRRRKHAASRRPHRRPPFPGITHHESRATPRRSRKRRLRPPHRRHLHPALCAQRRTRSPGFPVRPARRARKLRSPVLRHHHQDGPHHQRHSTAQRVQR